MDSFQTGRSPALNALLEAARLCFERPDQLPASHLADHLQHVAEIRRNLEAQYLENSKIRPRTDLFRQLDPLVRNQFQEFRQGLKTLDRYFDDPRSELLQEGCRRAAQAVERLMDYSDQLRAEETEFPVYSASPVVHELTHLALGVASGQIPEGLLLSRLDAFRAQVAATRGNYLQWTAGKAENEAVQELIPQVEQALAALAAGLDEMAAYKLERRKDHLRKGGEVILKASEALQTLQSRLLLAVAPPIICPRCSRENPSGSKFCGGCEARLPESGQPTSTSSFTVVSGGSAAPPRFGHLVRVEEAVVAYQQGSLSDDELKKTLDWFVQRVRSGRKNLANLAPARPIEDPLERDRAEAARARFEQASAQLLEAAEQLAGYFPGRQRERLDQGLESLRQAEQRMAEVHRDLNPSAASARRGG